MTIKRERIKRVEAEAPVIPVVTLTKFRKIGGGSLPLPDKIVKPNEVFYYDKNKIPVAFLDLLEVLDEKNIPAAPTPVKVKRSLYHLQEIPSKDGSSESLLFNVVNAEGKALNEEPLPIEAGKELIKALEA